MDFENITNTTLADDDHHSDHHSDHNTFPHNLIIILIIGIPSIIYTIWFWCNYCCRDIKTKNNNKVSNNREQRSRKCCYTIRKKSDEKVKIKHSKTIVKYSIYNMCFKTRHECSICLKSFGVKKATLECGHSYHDKCINEWLKNNKNCPLCRMDIV
jgi:hypothetical protein